MPELNPDGTVADFDSRRRAREAAAATEAARLQRERLGEHGRALVRAELERIRQRKADQ